MDQPGKVASPARGQLNRENNIILSSCVPENLVSRDGFSCPIPRQSAHLHTQTESGAYLWDSSRVPRRRPFMKPPYAIGSFPSFSGHVIACRRRSLLRVAQGISESKTEIMCMPIPRAPATKIVFNATGQRYRQTTSFTYLGGIVNETSNLSDEIDRRIRAGWMGFKRYKREL